MTSSGLKITFFFPSAIFFLNQIILTNPVRKVALQIIHPAERLLPKCKGSASGPGLNTAQVGVILSQETICMQNHTAWASGRTAGHLVNGETALHCLLLLLYWGHYSQISLSSSNSASKVKAPLHAHVQTLLASTLRERSCSFWGMPPLGRARAHTFLRGTAQQMGWQYFPVQATYPDPTCALFFFF